MPTQPRAYAWIDALVATLSDEPQIEAMRLALLLDGLVRSYASLERSLRASEPVPWLDAAVATRFPRLAGAAQQDVSDARLELEFAVDAVLRGVG
ncbi:hypothetical protein [Homoserinibacter gongjuensis]|uniref:Uncharacterized protein n=1 Tax=Homoserinibacter gongjuensis TaxID=1162968 RepID=A0ABQ6K187_9MICO|nr:hypothetical protein [Homoserinibacter gongjuensis]GMA92672.1 hypothetical protein GCM10025869_32010 [Homoserinibacter gongjuensis]